MPFLLRNITLMPGENEEILPKVLASRFSLATGELTGFRIARKAIDARKKSRILLVYSVEFSHVNEDRFWEAHSMDPDLEKIRETEEPRFPRIGTGKRILITGSGPAGLFAAIRLAEYGLAPLVLERGDRVENRYRDVCAFWRHGTLDPESNVQFGEGGAGTFSDGKLTTRVRDPNSRYVLETLARFGAPEETLYLAKPHIGTDRLRRVLVNIRGHLESRGVEFRFRHKVTGIISRNGSFCSVTVNGSYEEAGELLILAPGNSARDTYEMLDRLGISLELKPFAVGVRVEHPQELIDRIQYGRNRHSGLPPADYSLAWNNERTGRSAYSFCMCPGGVVVGAASETGCVVTNGMSDYLRDARMANSALVVTVGGKDFAGDSTLAGVDFQRRLERAAYTAGGGVYKAPAQNLISFLDGKGGAGLNSSYLPGVVEADLTAILPGFISESLKDAIRVFDRKMRGFITTEATLTGVETRTSAPLRIIRGDDLQSPSMKGFYPAGEGAGYAGGIMSSALDGIRVADAIARSLM